jgi:hypothetical protein
MDPQTQLHLEIAKLVVTALVSLIVGGVTGWIALSQKRIAQQQARTAAEQRKVSAAKLNLDLFEERYALFYKVWGFLSDALEDTADKVPHPLRPEFTNLIPKARFLFGNEIADYMIEANTMRVRLFTVLRQQERGEGLAKFEGRTLADYQQWFAEEATKCFKRFADYLDFSAWKRD